MTFLIVIACILGYAFVGGIVGSRHHAIESRKCRYGAHFDSTWCPHACVSLWLYGVFWVLALPIAGGTLIGSADKETRIERRRAREIEEAKHKAEVARYARIEDEELTRRLASMPKRVQ